MGIRCQHYRSHRICQVLLVNWVNVRTKMSVESLGVRRFTQYMFFRIRAPENILKNFYYLDLDRPKGGPIPNKKRWAESSNSQALHAHFCSNIEPIYQEGLFARVA